MTFSEATRKKYVRIHENWKLLDDLSLDQRPESIRQALEMISEKTKSNFSQGNGSSNERNKPVKAIIHTKVKDEITSILENSKFKDQDKIEAIKKFLLTKELHYSLKPAKDEEASSDSHKTKQATKKKGTGSQSRLNNGAAR